MARLKRSIVQRDFSLGELREEFLERDDLDVRGKSLRKAYNIRLLATGGIEARPGSRWIANSANAAQIIEFEPQDGNTYALLIRAAAISVRESDGTEAYSSAAPWTSSAGVWVVPYRNTVICGYPDGIHVLELNDGTWSFSAFVFAEGSNGETRQPYLSFHPGVRIEPSARTGAVTVLASEAVFTADHVGTVIRYAGREIEVTAYISATEVDGDVLDTLPPTWEIEVADVDGFRVGDAILGQDSGFAGVVVVVDTLVPSIYVLATETFEPPTVAENVSGPNRTQAVVAVTEIVPYETTIWDEALISPVHGYPGSASMAAGRLVFCDFPDAPSLIAASSVRAVNDFKTGAEDDDAIIREIGDGAPKFRHVINAGDLILLSDKGLYFQNLRDALLTPASFNPVLFDGRGATTVKPVLVNDAVVFVESGGERIGAAFQAGNIYLKWSCRTLSSFHSQLIRTPVALCGPPQAPTLPESYVMVVNNDGSLAVASWEVGSDTIGFVRWQTRGFYKAMAPVFGGYWSLTDRLVGSTLVRMIEVMDFDMFLDCAKEVDPNAAGAASHLVGQTLAVCWNDRFAGEAVVAGDGSLDFPDVTTAAQVGFNFTTEAQPWPVEIIDAPYVGLKRVRATRFGVSVQDSGPFQMRCNAFTRVVGGYAFGDDLSDAPELKERLYVAPVTGRPDHHTLAAIRHEPGPWRVLSMAQEVTG